ncbi:MAG: hypothetical protein WC343_08230, partial [Bacilli bacterium]
PPAPALSPRPQRPSRPVRPPAPLVGSRPRPRRPGDHFVLVRGVAMRIEGGKMEKEELYNEAWKTWGSDSQIDVLIEEMLELIHELLKARRRGVTWNNAIFEEIADVLICLEQVETRLKMLPTDIDRKTNRPAGYLFDFVEDIKSRKLSRLEERLQAAKAEVADA